MGIFSRFENKAENVIEGSGSRGRGGIEPVKLAKRAVKEMEREKMVGVGHEYAPTLYNILLSPEDDAAMNGYYPSLAGEIETYLTGQGTQSGLVFDCPPLVRFIVDDGLKRGKFDIIAESVSPAIIEELRHEEMVRYGIERDHDSRPDYDYEPEPRAQAHPQAQPQAQPQPQVPQEEPLYAQMDLPYDQPVQDPMAAPLVDPFVSEDDEAIPEPSSDRTVMLADAIDEQAPAGLYNLKTQQFYRLRDDRTVIGRETSCDIVIPDPSVSRRHAEVLHNDTGWLIRDTGSTNGLIVNGVITTQSRIYDGDIIDMGTTQLEFQEG